ncbi:MULTISPECIES: LysR substrate-binding domain-containing protein [unclassified Arthrobacter]|uniref:LysR substrate-binding domain-containing protein n=1 Tax=unclassified Arthrobacter TaxID=235627 RepID=UPI00159E4027|nr:MULTISPECIES: LysR substrate-binding domain-containing protein [unclassified Arthrobacter]MCQ9164754.1 LysR substrate-binding domain-containing protein [Arthrobacter sp. STN4]NVM98798.1 LysR family transcriptional regulator [Arthrobacter sp. SDTb3-6]
MHDTPTFDPVQLKSFLAVAETRNFTRAAERLGISQPTVSQHVRKLEQAAGRVLVARDTRDVRLTDNGDAMAGFARTILAANDAATRYFSGAAMRGRLRFGTADDLAITGLPRILREFRQLYPQINLELTVSQSDQLHRRLKAGALDLVFVKWVSGAQEGEVVKQDTFAWVGLEQTVLEPGAPVPVIVYPAPSLSRKLALDALEQAGRTWRITCSTKQISGVLAALRAGIGIAVMPTSLVPDDLKVITRRFELPPVGDVDFTLIRNPLANTEVVDALTQAIMGRKLTPLSRR